MSALDAELFRRILKNLKVKNYQEIARRRGEIAKALNREYRDLPTSMANVLMVGSYGRHTAINGISDLDLLYILPSELRNKYRSQDGPSKVLERTKKAIAAHYSTTRVSVSQLVVVVEFQDFTFEVQPVFRDKDGDFVYPDTRKKIWCYTKPGKEIDAIKIFNEETSGALRYLCRLMRAWKDKHDVHMGGLLIDTLAFNFLKEKEEYRSVDEPGLMIRDFFEWLSNQSTKKYYLAPGSNQQVIVKQAFQRKASSAYELACRALCEEEVEKVPRRWHELFGRAVPLSDSDRMRCRDYVNTEQFIEDLYPQNIRYTLDIDCEVIESDKSSCLSQWLRRALRLPRHLKLLFNVVFCDVPEPFEIKWKVLNQGEQAMERDMIRGTILDDDGSRRREESTDFFGNHYVECYAIKGGELVARAHISVPID